MLTINEIRQKYPQYSDMSDEELTGKLHEKYYSDMPKTEFYSKIAENKKEEYEPTSSTGAFLRSAGRATPEIIGNIINKLGHISPKMDLGGIQQEGYKDVNLVPDFLKQKSGDKSHPISEFAGGLIGGIPAGGAAIKGARAAFPLWKAIAERASPSFARRAGVGAVEGSGIGASFSPPGQEGQGALMGGALGGAGYSLIPSIAKGLKSIPSRAKSVRDVDMLRSQLENSGISDEQASSLLQEEESRSNIEHGTSNPESILHSINELMKKKQSLGETPKESLMPHEFEKMAPKVKSLLKTREQELAEAENAVSEHLGEGQAHHVRFANRVNELHEPVIAENKKTYETIEKNLKNKNVEIKESRSAKDIMEEMNHEIRQGGFESQKVKDLSNLLSQGVKSKTVSARDYLAMYRTARDAAYDAYLDSKNNPNDEARIRARKLNEELGSQAAKMYKLLKESIGDEDAKLLEDATTQFRTVIAPMRENRLYRTEIKPGSKEKVSGSLLEKTTGGDRGLHIIQDYVKNDPELKRLILGQMFADKPQNITAKNELTQPLINKSPQLKQLISQQQAARSSHQDTQGLLENAKIHDIEQSIIQKERANKIEKQQKYRMIEEKIESLQRTVDHLNKLIENKNIAAKNRDQYQHDLHKAENDIKSLKKMAARLTIAAGTIATSGIALKKYLQ